MGRRYPPGRTAQPSCGRRSRNAAWAGFSFSRAASIPNQAAWSTSGNVSRRPERGGHSSSKRVALEALDVEVALDRERHDVLAALQAHRAELGQRARRQGAPELLVELPPGTGLGIVARPRTRPSAATRRRRPCGSRTARRGARAAPRSRPRPAGRAGSRRCAWRASGEPRSQVAELLPGVRRRRALVPVERPHADVLRRRRSGCRPRTRSTAGRSRPSARPRTAPAPSARAAKLTPSKYASVPKTLRRPCRGARAGSARSRLYGCASVISVARR